MLISFNLHAQTLKPFIGLIAPPNKSDKMCVIQNYLGSFETSGYHVGDTVNDFRIYNLDFQALSLSESLKKGKPILLISSSYTCPVFRDKVPVINEIASLFKNQLEIFVIYTVEAHPDKDISPYFGVVHTGSKNIDEGILYRQPQVYEDRMKIASDMLNKIKLDVPVYLDGPCNEWWNHFGPAPNNATLIDPDGIVRIKHAWFDREPDNIICDLKKYFDPKAVCDTIPSGNSQFEFSMNTDTLVKGDVNSALFVSGTIKNISNVPVKIDIRRLENNLPANWLTSMCIDLCYPTDVDSTMITLKANEQIDLIIDFFTGPNPAQGNVRIGMRNVDHPQNKAIMRATAQTSNLTNTTRKEKYDPNVLIYPQPSTSFLRIKTNDYNQYILFDEKGTVYQKGWIDESETIERNNITSGLYLLKLSNADGDFLYKKVIFN
jgi:hypothetical protein